MPQPDFSIAFGQNGELPKVISGICSQLSIENFFNSVYIPKLKIDIVIAIKSNKTQKCEFILLEVKYSDTLTLQDYSQLTGYLQVAKFVELGLLCLVAKPGKLSSLSNDFSDFIKTKSLPMSWKMILDKLTENEQYKFHTGICSYVPGNGLDWIDCSVTGGFATIATFTEKIKQKIV